MKDDLSILKATVFIVILVIVALVDLILILEQLNMGIKPFAFLDSVKKEVSNLIANFNYALQLVKESSKMLPGSGKLILFLLMILLLAVPIEILAWLRRR